MKKPLKYSLKILFVIGVIVFLAVCISLNNSYIANATANSQNSQNPYSGNVQTNQQANSQTKTSSTSSSQINPLDAIKSMASALGLSSLHNPPLSSDTPKIQVYLSGTSYSIEVIDKKVSAKQSAIQNPDLIIKTNLEEIGKMVADKNYIKQSFNSGNSNIEIVAGEMTLLLKGYTKIYSSIA
jgi:hypothetical protein